MSDEKVVPKYIIGDIIKVDISMEPLVVEDVDIDGKTISYAMRPITSPPLLTFREEEISVGKVGHVKQEENSDKKKV